MGMIKNFEVPNSYDMLKSIVNPIGLVEPIGNVEATRAGKDWTEVCWRKSPTRFQWNQQNNGILAVEFELYQSDNFKMGGKIFNSNRRDSKKWKSVFKCFKITQRSVPVRRLLDCMVNYVKSVAKIPEESRYHAGTISKPHITVGSPDEVGEKLCWLRTVRVEKVAG
ncbi:hypothetical protein AMTR_s00069p00147590 [Amborella trichopoda]|uniref:Uncharacterized protein n=1 Tax=Amborella trichopoda TaxID=13333 RepID=U5DAX5_AMBTC|nr:hypothetical protein AMTR_s00069p00147590 [Amborella trichopoda]